MSNLKGVVSLRKIEAGAKAMIKEALLVNADDFNVKLTFSHKDLGEWEYVGIIKRVRDLKVGCE